MTQKKRMKKLKNKNNNTFKNIFKWEKSIL